MKFLWGSKDGGPESNVRMWGFESKMFGSALVLCFGKGSREAYHTHAFNAISWVLTGGLKEEIHPVRGFFFYFPSFKPIFTSRDTFHKVHGLDYKNWVLTFRGPWRARWREYLPKTNKYQTLTHGREVVA